MSGKITPVEEYFDQEIARRLKPYAIDCMEHLLVLSKKPGVLDDLAKIIGMDKDQFWNTIQRSKWSVGVPEDNDAEYLSGAKEPRKGKRWVLVREGEGPFSRLNVASSCISTQAACEEMGFAPKSKSMTELVEDYHRR